MQGYVPRHLEWPDCHNARDLGDLPTSGGRAIKPGALIRADNLNQLTSDGVATLHAAGVSRVIDLRPARTCRREPTPFSDHRLGRNLSVQGVADPPDPSTTLTESYCFLLDRNPGLFAAVIQEIAEAPAGAVVVHCHSGKDRTGLVIALALTMVGADRSAILADYALSNDRVAATYAGGRHPGATPGPSLRDHRTARRETLLRTLEHLDRRYGCVAEYLAAGWLHPDVPATLSDRLTQPTPRAARG